MRRTVRALAIAFIVSLPAMDSPALAAPALPAVTDAAGHPIRTLDGAGRLVSVAPRTIPGVSITSTASPPIGPCGPAQGQAGRVSREHRGPGFTVDACGRVRTNGPATLPEPAAGVTGWAARSLLGGVTIDSMTTQSYVWNTSASPTITLLGSAATYFLSDGTSWTSGAGSYRIGTATLQGVEVSGATVRYYFSPPFEAVLYQQTDFDSGDHSAQGTLGTDGPLLLEATLGSSRAVMRGVATVVSNDATWYGEPRFNFYSAPVGALVSWEVTYTISAAGGWTADAFEHPLTASAQGWVDFVHPVPVTPLAGLAIVGPERVTGPSTFPYRGVARYENSYVKNVTTAAQWTVEPATHASIADGLLTTLPIPPGEEVLTIAATYAEGGVDTQARSTVLYRSPPPVAEATSWPMYQADSRHTGHVALSLRVEDFALRWQQSFGDGSPLNPVTADDDKVFCSLLVYFQPVPSLFGVAASDGSLMWSKNFGSVFSVNPPSFGNGKVYVQTGNHASDTWLHTYDASSGDLVFESPHSAQWERYLAPTIFDGNVYLNGGYYGGMYAFDGGSGASLWFRDLPQYDQWTPAVDEEFAYSYVGGALYAVDRATGAIAFTIPDPHFEWNGWSMNLAPVIGAHEDVLVIHDDRLIEFDPSSRTIRWELQRRFQGQPSVAHDVIYAIDGGDLVALHEVTHADLWSWRAPTGPLTSNLVVTETHVFVCTDEAVYAVDLAAHAPVWSYPASGHLALGNRTLYIASAHGVLTAIHVAAPQLPPDCSAATAEILGPTAPNHQLAPISIRGVTDPEGGSVRITVTAIAQDEPVNATADGNTCPDARIAGDGSAAVRLERNATGNGRVYTISFTATDESGSSCDGVVTLCVPHDRGGEPDCVPDAAAYDATARCVEEEPPPLEVVTVASLRMLGAEGSRVTLEYALPERGSAELAVFDVTGRRVSEIESRVAEAGRHRVVWDATGRSNGIYFARLRTKSAATTTRVVVAR